MADTPNTAACLLALPDGKFVFERRTKDAPVSASMLSLFGGHLEVGESDLHAVRREMSEETSLDISDLHVKHIGRFRSAIRKADMDLYIAHVTSQNFKVFEGERPEVYGIDEVLSRGDLDPDARQVITKYKELADAKHN